MSHSTPLKYQALLLENPDITIITRGTLNIAALLPSPDEDTSFHSCHKALSLSYSPRGDLTNQPLENPMTSGSQIEIASRQMVQGGQGIR